MNHDQIACFLHIQKAGGTTLESVLRRYFAVRHLDAHPGRGWMYTQRELAADLRLNPFLRSIAGHWVRPFVDYGVFERRLLWWTVLRDPIKRYISHYQHHVEKMGSSVPFEEWSRREDHWNWQVRLIAGEPDLVSARRILADKFRFVGLLERFNESLLLLRFRLGLDNFKVAYKRAKNPALSGSVRDQIMMNYDRFRDRLEEANALDVELYRYVSTELFESYIQEYGRERLQADLQTEFAIESLNFADVLRERSNDLVRKALYKPLVMLRGQVARLRGVPDVRR